MTETLRFARDDGGRRRGGGRERRLGDPATRWRRCQGLGAGSGGSRPRCPWQPAGRRRRCGDGAWPAPGAASAVRAPSCDFASLTWERRVFADGAASRSVTSESARGGGSRGIAGLGRPLGSLPQTGTGGLCSQRLAKPAGPRRTRPVLGRPGRWKTASPTFAGHEFLLAPLGRWCPALPRGLVGRRAAGLSLPAARRCRRTRSRFSGFPSAVALSPRVADF